MLNTEKERFSEKKNIEVICYLLNKTILSYVFLTWAPACVKYRINKNEIPFRIDPKNDQKRKVIYLTFT